MAVAAPFGPPLGRDRPPPVTQTPSLTCLSSPDRLSQPPRPETPANRPAVAPTQLEVTTLCLLRVRLPAPKRPASADRPRRSTTAVPLLLNGPRYLVVADGRNRHTCRRGRRGKGRPKPLQPSLLPARLAPLKLRPLVIGRPSRAAAVCPERPFRPPLAPLAVEPKTIRPRPGRPNKVSAARPVRTPRLAAWRRAPLTLAAKPFTAALQTATPVLNDVPRPPRPPVCFSRHPALQPPPSRPRALAGSHP